MKKIIILIVAIFTISIANAQTLVDTNKVWTVVESINLGASGTSIYKFQGDTIIIGNNYKKLYFTSDSTMTTWYYCGAFREDSTKKVYRQSSPYDILYYDFGLSKNDTVTVHGLFYNPLMVVDSVDTVTLITGEKRKAIYLHDSVNYCNDEWIDGIGSILGILNVDASCAIDVYYNLNCFIENDTLKYHTSFYPTCYYNTEGINENIINNIVTIYPNPTKDNLTIETNSNTAQKLEITNLIGQTIYTSYINKKATINTSVFAKGVYVLKLSSDKETVVKKFIKQ